MSSVLSVEVVDPDRRLSEAALAWLITHVEKAARALGVHGEVRIRVVGDAEMAKAHEEFAGVAGTTDVLTFDLTDPEEPRAGEGSAVGLDDSGSLSVRYSYGIDTDILACFDEAVRQSGVRGHQPEAELLLYSVHGMLHCLGFDDHEEAAAALMHRLEDAVLTAIGVGAVYHRGFSAGG